MKKKCEHEDGCDNLAMFERQGVESGHSSCLCHTHAAILFGLEWEYPNNWIVINREAEN